MLLERGDPLPKIFLILSLRIEGVLIDAMHCCDQGISPHILANCIIEMLPTFGPNQKDQVQALRTDLDRWYKANKGRHRIQGKLTFERLRTKSDWPKLKCKAAAARHFTYYVLELCETHNSGNLHDQRRLALVQCLARFYDILDEAPRWLSDDIKTELKDMSKLMRQLYCNLSQEALLRRKRSWKATAKLHMFEHVCGLQTFLGNPSSTWCYSDEDLQRIVKEIALSCHVNTVEYLALYKWVIHIFDDFGS
jgi:hypothetical protein